MQYNMETGNSSSSSSPPNQEGGQVANSSSQEPLRRMSAPYPEDVIRQQQQQQQQQALKKSDAPSQLSPKNTKSKDASNPSPKKRALALRDASMAGLEDRHNIGGMILATTGGDTKRPRIGSLRTGGEDVQHSPATLAAARRNMGSMGMSGMTSTMNMNASNFGNLAPGMASPAVARGEVTFPRAPASPGVMGAASLNLPLGHTLRGNDNFGDANAALRRNLVTMQHRQTPNQGQQQQMQMQDLQLQQFLQERQFQEQHFGSAGGMGSGMPFSSGNQASMGNVQPTQQQQAWFLRNQQGGGPSLALPSSMTGNAPGAAGSSGAPRMEDGLMQLQLFRQQQERLRQLEQMEQESASRRRQLQLLRGSGNRNMSMGFGGAMPGSQSATMPPSQDPSSVLGDSLLLQHRFRQQQEASSGFQNATEQQMQIQFLSSQQNHQQRMSQLLNEPNAGQSIGHRGSISSVATGETSKPRNTRPTRKPMPSSMARATPMVGPIASPVPAPPPHLTGQAVYQLPPIDEGETLPHGQRVHVPLAIEEDPNWLSEFQSFVRAELLEVFRASHQDVKIRVASKKVFYQQVGIRCRYCAHCRPSTRAIRSSAFPSSIRQLYQSFTMMLRDHFGNCHAIPAPLKERFLELKRNNTQGASDSMRYWVYSAVKLGMVDTDNGIVLSEPTQTAARSQPPFGSTISPDGSITSKNAADHPARLLIQPDDREKGNIASEFLHSLLGQYQLIRLLPTECIGNRKSLRPGVPGLGCRYCCEAGRLGLSRVFPAKKKQMPGQIQDLYDHMRRCNLCPSEVKGELIGLKQERDQERCPPSEDDSSVDKEVKGKIIVVEQEEDKAFIELLWQRLGHRGELATPAL